MKLKILTALLLGTSATAAYAGGLDRSGQSINDIFETGTVARFSFGATNPDVSGTGVSDIGQGFGSLGASYKTDLSDNLSVALIWDQPFGSDVRYNESPAASAYGGTVAQVDTNAITGVVNYRFSGGFSVHGGLRVQQASGTVVLNGLAYGPAAGYTLDLDNDTGVGYLAGVAYERPDIALRVSLTYNSEIDHSFSGTETGPGAAPTGPSGAEVTTPESWNLAFQSGVAKDTLVFGSIRYVPWGDFAVPAARLGGINLASIDDSTTFTLGVGRRFNENWSGSAILGYEREGDPVVSALSPTNGYTSLSLAAIYTMDNMKITTGIRYTRLGDAVATSGGGSVPFQDNSALSAGISVAYTF